jgi:hypothetical protein
MNSYYTTCTDGIFCVIWGFLHVISFVGFEGDPYILLFRNQEISSNCVRNTIIPDKLQQQGTGLYVPPNNGG